jgi:hypothetical protein
MTLKLLLTKVSMTRYSRARAPCTLVWSTCWSLVVGTCRPLVDHKKVRWMIGTSLRSVPKSGNQTPNTRDPEKVFKGLRASFSLGLGET